MCQRICVRVVKRGHLRIVRNQALLQTNPQDMILQDSRNGLSMFDAFFRNDGEVANGNPIIGHKVFQRVLVVINNFIRWETRRHNGQASLWASKPSGKTRK